MSKHVTPAEYIFFDDKFSDGKGRQLGAVVQNTGAPGELTVVISEAKNAAIGVYYCGWLALMRAYDDDVVRVNVAVPGAKQFGLSIVPADAKDIFAEHISRQERTAIAGVFPMISSIHIDRSHRLMRDDHTALTAGLLALRALNASDLLKRQSIRT